MSEYDLGNAKGKIILDSSEAKRGAREANKALDDIEGKSRSTGDALFKLSTAFAAVGAAGVAGFGLAIKTAADFEKTLSGIQAVSGATEKELDSLRKKALQLGKDTAFSAVESASAMEELVKAGLSVEDVLNGAADATVALAAAGQVDLATAATIASNAMNQFNLSAEQMPHIADLIAGAANSSAIDVNDFGMSLAQAGATANLIGLSFDDLAVAIAAMGNAGVKGSDAGTSMKTFLQNLQPVTEKQIDLFATLGITMDGLVTPANSMGNAFFNADGSIKSLADIAGVLEDALYGMSDAQKTATLEAIFGTDAIRAAAIIADTGAEGFDTLAASMGKMTAADVAQTRLDNLSGSMTILKGSVETALIAIGDAFLPMLKTFVDYLTTFVNKFLEMNPETQKWISYIGAGAAALALVVGGLGVMAHVMSPVISAVKLLALAFSETTIAMLASPITWIILAIVALAAAFVYAYTHFEGFREGVNNVVGAIVKFGKEVWRIINDVILPVLKKFGEWFMDEVYPRIVSFVQGAIKVISAIWNWLSGTFWPAVQSVWDGIVQGAQAAWQWFNDNVVSTIVAIVEFIIAVFDKIRWFFETVLMPAIQQAWNIIGPIIKYAFDIIIGIIDNAMKIILGIWNVVWGAIKTAWDLFGDNIVGAITLVFNIIKGIVEFVLGIIRGIFQTLTGLISGDWDKFLEGLKTLWETIWNAIKLVFETIWNGIQLAIETAIDVISLAWDTFTSVLSTAWDLLWNGIKSTFDTIWGAIQTAIDIGVGIITGFWDTLTTTTETVWNGIRDTIQGVIDGITGVVTGLWDAITGGIKGAINGVIDAINWVIDFINSIEIHLTIPVPIPFVDDIHWDWDGLNIPTIPRLAKGGVFAKEMLAIIGEAGAEAVIPLTNTPRALELMNQSGLDKMVLENALSGLRAGSGGGIYAPTPVPQAPTGSGPAVAIDTANFYDGIDFRTLMTEAELAHAGRF